MTIEIISPEKKIFSGEVHLVQLPGTIGSFEIMNNHAPTISTLESGRIKVISKEGDVQYFDINGGVVEVSKNIITVLADS